MCVTFNLISLSCYMFYSSGSSQEGDTGEKLTFQKNATYSLLLPGNILNLTVLNSLRKFRDKGNKAGAVSAWKLLDEAGIGKLVESKARRGTDMVRMLASFCLTKMSCICIFTTVV